MTCDKCLELLSARLDSALTGEEERELEAHLAVCPECRAAEAQLAELRTGFAGLEEVPAPEGFTQGVMDRIRISEPKKVIPLFKRPQFRALAGLAACLALAVGLYGASRPQHGDEPKKMEVTARGFEIDAAARSFDQSAPLEDGDGPRVNAALVDPGPEGSSAAGAPGIAPSAFSLPAERWADSAVLAMDRLPEGAAELIAPEVAVSYNADTGEEGYNWMTEGEPEALAQIEALAKKQGICCQRSGLPAEECRYDLVVAPPEG